MTGLFLTALAGVVTIVGMALAAWTPWTLLPYVAVLLVAALAVVRRARALRPRSDGRTCDCCSSTVHDPVKVI